MKSGPARLNLLVCHTLLCVAVFAASGKDDPAAPAPRQSGATAVANHSEMLPISSIRSLEPAPTAGSLTAHFRPPAATDQRLPVAENPGRWRGASSIVGNESRPTRAFHLALLLPKPIQLLENPPGWSARNSFAVLGIITAIILGATFCGMALRRRVGEQTAGLRQSELIFRSLVEQSPVGVYIIQNGRFVYINPRLAEIYGFTSEEMLRSCAVRDIVHAADWPKVEDQIQRRITNEVATAHYNFRGRRKDGSLIFVEVLGSRTEYGGQPAIAGTLLDLTERNRAEKELAEASNLLQTMLDNCPEYIYFKDLESRFVRCSRSFAKNLQLPDVNVLKGKSDFEVFTEERARAAHEDDQQIIRTGEPIVGKLEQETHADGRITWALTTRLPWREESGRIIGTFGISKDVTALKETEAKLEAAQERLVETSRLAGMAEVASDVLHNVGNVLNSVNVGCSLSIDRVKSSKISGLVKISALLDEHGGRLGEFFTNDSRGRQIPSYIAALSEHLADDQSAHLKELEQLVKHIDHIKQIVAMQQSYAKVSGNVEIISPVQLVEDALHINAAALTRHDIHLRREFEETPAIETEKHKVLQILVNLIRNAKYALDESQQQEKIMTIKIGNDAGGAVKIQVVDNGVGIPRENLTRIFAHGFTTRRHGHGFGLHSCALAVRELGGSLQAQSDGPDRGATFTLLLPGKPPVQFPEKVQEAA